MPKIKIEGKHILSGTIDISGAKNSAVALIPAAILCDEECTISNVPQISDVEALEEILTYLNFLVKINIKIYKIIIFTIIIMFAIVYICRLIWSGDDVVVFEPENNILFRMIRVIKSK